MPRRAAPPQSAKPAHAARRPLRGAEAARAGHALLAWYDRHKREMPWRTAAGEADPYRVWLSEVMLQQTTVAAVRPYFEAFTARWPTVDALAAADDGEVMAAWAGLGYYARARNLLKCARAVSARGAFPATQADLKALPGIGEYTSAAIAAIAFGERAVVVDGNVERVVARLIALPVPPKSAKNEVAGTVEAMLPRRRPGDFAQAMMDLGATICTPKTPACGICPVANVCAAKGTDPAAFPVQPPKRPRQNWTGVAFVPWRADGTTLLRRRPERGLLGGMMELFGSPWSADPLVEASAAHAPFNAKWTLTGTAEHGFTHALLSLDVYAARVPQTIATPVSGVWAIPEEAGLPTVMRKVVERAAAFRP